MTVSKDDSGQQESKPTPARNDGAGGNVPDLLNDLAKGDITARRQARERLMSIGEPALPELLEGLARGEFQLRWEIAKTLGEMRLPGSIPALIEALEDDEQDVRWLAAVALAKLEEEAILLLLEALIANSDSGFLRQGTHHVLTTYRDKDLDEALMRVRDALGPMENPVDVIPVAQKALRALRP